MAKFKSEHASFSIPDHITVEKQLEYVSIVTSFKKKDRMKNYWIAAKGLVEDWKCKLIPDINEFDLAESTNPTHASIVSWVGMKVYIHLNSLDNVSKN